MPIGYLCQRTFYAAFGAVSACCVPVFHAEAYASEKVAAIEFSEEGTNRFGGDICTSVLADVTPQSLASRFGHVPSQFNGMTFEIKSWNGTYDAKGIIEKTEHGYKIVQ